MEAMRLDPNMPGAREQFLISLRSSIIKPRLQIWMLRKLPRETLGFFVILSLVIPPSVIYLGATQMGYGIEACMAAAAIALFPWIRLFGSWLIADWILQLGAAHRDLMSGLHRLICWAFVATIAVSYTALIAGLVFHAWDVVYLASLGAGVAICVLFAGAIFRSWNR